MALLLSKAKKIARETALREVFGKYRGKPIIMEILPSNEIVFRIKGTRQTFTAHVAHLFTTAKIIEAKSQYDKKMERYQKNKNMGTRFKKPKKLFLPYASNYVKSILG